MYKKLFAFLALLFSLVSIEPVEADMVRIFSSGGGASIEINEGPSIERETDYEDYDVEIDADIDADIDTSTVDLLEAAYEAGVPRGRYKYLFSNGFTKVFFNDRYTLFFDNVEDVILFDGDFSYDLPGQSLSRSGSYMEYYYEPEGTYYHTVGTAYTYFRPNRRLAPYISLLTPGSIYEGEYGIYKKTFKGKIRFIPEIQYPTLVIR